MDTVLPLKCGYDTVLQGNSSKSAAVHSCTPSENCEQNTVTTLNDIVNERHVVKEEGKCSESLVKPGNKNTAIKHEKLAKEETVVDTDHKVSGINTISGKQNAVKGINSNEKNKIYRHRVPQSCLCMTFLVVLIETISAVK